MADTEKQRHFFEQHILELSMRASRGGYPVFTDFLTAGEQAAAIGMKRRIRENAGDICMEMWGGHFDCSYTVAGFFPREYHEYDKPSLFPVSCILIEPMDSRYTSNASDKGMISHRDYLGSVLGLGLGRQKIGDIRMDGQSAYLFCKEEITSFILEQLHTVRHTVVSCHLIENPEQIPKQQYQVLARTVASLRLDNIVAAMAGVARGKAVDLVSQGKVIVNSAEQTSVSYPCKDGCIISIRGYGKFRMNIPDFSVTKKGKHKIQIYKFI